MKITVGFKALSSVLSYPNAVLSDKGVDEKMKNVIFMVSPSDVTVVGYNPFTFSRTSVEDAVVEGVAESWQFQTKASELNKIVSAFSNLSKTVVENIDFEDDGVRVKVTVHERAINDADERLSQDSVFYMENPPILAGIDKEIHLKFPDESNMTASGDLLLYIDSIAPMLSSSEGIASNLNFASDWVFCISPHWSAFMKNRLPEEFREICLGYSSVSFLKKLCESIDSVCIARLDNYICVESGNTQAFMRYKNVKLKYQQYVSRKSSDMGFVVDRLYLKDVLRRMSVGGADGKITVESEDTLVVENDTFQQEIPLVKCKGDVVGTKFKVSISALEQLILGKDDVFSSDLYCYVVKTARGYMLYFCDKSGVWFTNAQVAAA